MINSGKQSNIKKSQLNISKSDFIQGTATNKLKVLHSLRKVERATRS